MAPSTPPAEAYIFGKKSSTCGFGVERTSVELFAENLRRAVL